MSYVIVECVENKDDGVTLEVEDVKFLNVEEDIFGCDVLTFVCPLCGKTHKSNVYK